MIKKSDRKRNDRIRKRKGKEISSSALALTVTVLAFVLALFCVGCQQTDYIMKDGFYSAEAMEFDEHGWKEYITIYVSGNTIITVDYNAKNASGFIKSWDMEYMSLMNLVDGTYPNEYARKYAEALLSRQDPERVDAITGATHSHSSFQTLAKAAIEQAYKGNEAIYYVDFSGTANE